jgi:hypothetical protein
MTSTTGENFVTPIPQYEQDADIKAAFELYHNGQGNTKGMDDHLKDLDDRLDVVEVLGIGAKYQDQPPTLNDNGEDLPDGYIWVDADSVPTALPNGGVAIVSSSTPVLQPGQLVNGLLWVDTSAAPTYTIKFYDLAGEAWRAIS